MNKARRLLVLALAAGVACCGTRLVRQLHPPSDVAALSPAGSPYLKAHCRDGRVYMLSEWQIDEARRTLSGQGEVQGPDRRVRGRGALQLSLDDVVLFETNRRANSPTLAAMAVVTGISVAVTAFCISDPKACFGSCPTFYGADDGRSQPMAEGFSASVAPSLEATDVDALYRWTPRGSRVRIEMRNEALETHVVRHVNLLAAARPPNGRVLATESGGYRAAFDLAPPRRCQAVEGDCLSAVQALDGAERFSSADGSDLAARETIDLDFGGVAGDVGLVVASRQTLLSTYVFYQTLAHMGRDASAWLARLERSDARMLRRARGVDRRLGGIEVQVPRGQGWATTGAVAETGPLATDVKVVPLPRQAEGHPVRVRLRLTRGHWRIDWLALARLGASVTPTRLQAVSVEQISGEATSGALPDGRLVTFPGDAYAYGFELPGEAAGYELFLESRGYYLEWMRDEWMREEDPQSVRRQFRDPAAALRELAANYKRQEADMERIFWSSRYALP